jgi:hypothetical protein
MSELLSALISCVSSITRSASVAVFSVYLSLKLDFDPTQTLAQDPNTNSRKVYDSRCVVLRRLERFPEALKDARKLIEIDASSPQVSESSESDSLSWN